MASQMHQLHFLLVPLMSQSHLIPFTDLAKVLAQRGLTITIVISPLNALRYNKIIDYATNSNLKIHFLEIPFPSPESGLLKGCENLDSLPSQDLIPQFFEASNMIQEPLEKWIAELDEKPNCIVSDICFPWTSNLALKFNIPRVIFHGISCFTLLCSHNIIVHKVDLSVLSDTDPFLVPEMPDRIELTKSQMPKTIKRSSEDGGDLSNLFKEAERSSQGVVVNTFEELELPYIKGYEKVAKKVWSVGTLSLCNESMSSKFERGNKASIDEPGCLKWLDSKKPSSVLYVCFGSLCRLSLKQLIELGMGLESSNCQFIWVIRKGYCSKEVENWLLEENFEKQLKGRGLVIVGWAPQVLILSHKAIGGFLTHCGWNSTLEGVSAGVPMLTWPMFAEQFYNEKLIVQLLKIGVRVGVETSVDWGDEEKVRLLVTREDINKAIEEVMSEGEEGKERRERARELGDLAKKAVQEGGSSYSNVTLFIQHIMQQV